MPMAPQHVLIFRVRSTGVVEMRTRWFGLKDRYCATLLACWAYRKLQIEMVILAVGERKTLEPLVEPLLDDLPRR